MLNWNKGILGINARNLLYIRPYNSKKAIKMADDKIKTKQFLSAREIPVPKLYGIIRDAEELQKFDFNSLPNNFVIKPNNGYGGEGIIPIVSKKEGSFITASHKELSETDIKDHINDILDGRFSISNIGDTAFFEQLIIPDDVLGKFSYAGLPDIRVVVHNLIPVMAMLRLPTKESNGKANLHLGAAGVGIDIAKGEATSIAYKNKIVEELPEGKGKIRGLKIPFWDQILLIASKVQLITNLGYMAVDISIDRHSGPVLLEINARAGLAVQIANLAPLRKRLERIEGVKVTNPIKGVRIAKDMFGNTVEKEIAHLSGKQVIGGEEAVEIIQKQGGVRAKAKIDTGRERSILDEEFAEQAGLLEDTHNYDDEKSTLKLKFSLKETRIQTVVDIEKIPSEKFKMIIGRRDLSNFLVDPNRNKQEEAVIPKTPAIKSEKDQKVNYREIDQELIQIDGKIKLLYHLRPLNLEAERSKFFEKPSSNPSFEYPQLKFDPLELENSLSKIKTDESSLGKIFEAKKREISLKINLIETIDQENFSKISTQLFGQPDEKDFKDCLEKLSKTSIQDRNQNETLYDSAETAKRFEAVFEKYGLKNWKIKIKENMVADCVAGKNNRLFINESAKFSDERINSLIVHEIETHIITAENGKAQPYDIFNRGLSNYLITQEGLAMYNVEQQMNTPFKDNYKALAHVVAIYLAIRHSFSEVYQKLLELGIPKTQAFRSCLKAKRGISDTSKMGSFTKDYIYYKGYNQVKEFTNKGGQLKDLYIGKLNIEDLEMVKRIAGIQEPKILPGWLK